MTNIYFADIPVYRLPPDRYVQDIGSFVEKGVRSTYGDDDAAKNFIARYPRKVDSLRDDLRLKFGGVWTFNEIIGYVRLYFSGTQILGEYWQMRGKQIRRTRRKIFEWRTWKLAPEIDVPVHATDDAIYELIRIYLADCTKELNGRYLDTAHFYATASYIRWRDFWVNENPDGERIALHNTISLKSRH